MKLFKNIYNSTEILEDSIENFEYEPGEIIEELFNSKDFRGLPSYFRERVSKQPALFEENNIGNIPIFKRIRQSLTKNKTKRNPYDN